jgi:hypothetical protein
MPRIGALLALSRDHHRALVIGRDARRAAASGDSVIWADTITCVEDYWHRSMAAHFMEEERLIELAREKLDPDAVARILSEHAELRALANGPSPLGPSPLTLDPQARLSRFGELLNAHVRYEERVFFPQLEQYACAAGTANDPLNPGPDYPHTTSKGDNA